MQQIQSTEETSQELGLIEQIKQMREGCQVTDLRSIIVEREDKDKKKNKTAVQALVEKASSKGEDIYNALSVWLDWLMEVFDSSHFVNGDFVANIQEQAKQQPIYYDLLHEWVHKVYRDKEHGKATDFFGDMYEENFRSSHKASTLGQFFTPMSLSVMMARLLETNEGNDTAMDCCCGSGRLLISKAEADGFSRGTFYMAGDIDSQSVKMCALNLMILGLQGIVLRQDALLLDEPKDILLINAVTYPCETGLRSITRYTTEEALRVGIIKQDDVEHYTVNGGFIAHQKRLFNLCNDIETPHEAEEPKDEVVQVVTEQPKAEHQEQKKERKEPIQLNLFGWD